jgi:hypothetical protein
MSDPRTDEELLAAVDAEPEAFGVFYRRHVRPLLGYALSRGVVEDRARRRLGMAPLELTDAAIERIEAEAGEVATAALDALPADQREAVRAGSSTSATTRRSRAPRGPPRPSCASASRAGWPACAHG